MLKANGTLAISGEGAMPDYNTDSINRAPWKGYADAIKKRVCV